MQISSVLKSWSIPHQTEREMQEAIEEILEAEGIEFTREHRLDSGSRIDFLTKDGQGIECKIKGGYSAVLRQLIRYAEFDDIKELVLVSSRSAHREFDNIEVQGKKISVIWANNLM